MHFFKNSVSFIALVCVCGAAFAATAPGRVGVLGTTSAAGMRRLPSLVNVKTKTSTATVSSTTSTTKGGTVILSDAECVDNYRDCMKADNVCGADFEECTTNVLFHGHMGECFSTLYQCSTAALETLFGTSSLDSLSDVDSYVEGTKKSDNDLGEVERYVYPTNGSIMGIDIIGAATRNKLSTADCVKKYKKCLNKDSVCGEDFELCTNESEFRKQAAMCDSTLARCQKEGFQQLFGDNVTIKPVGRNLKPSDGSTKTWVEDGATLAASNAVNTCYKVVDNCFLSACSTNPYSCVEGVDFGTLDAAELVGNLASNSGTSSAASSALRLPEIGVTKRTGKQMASDVRKFFRAACTDTIGENQYCFMTFNNGKKPTKADLQDEDLREDIFGEAYDTRKSIINTKAQELLKKFDTEAKNKCIDTFKSCAVRTCGGGSGAACYSRVFKYANKSVASNGFLGNLQNVKNGSINGDNTYNDVKIGCEAIVNTDVNCKYMAATMADAGNEYKYGFADDTAFNVLFPTYANGNSDSVVVAALNADLAASYNDVAIENMKKQCKNVVTNCVKSMCGNDYTNCYRNRSDIYTNTYATSGNGQTANGFDKSMNKVGGVLDYTIVQGLCALTVKNSDACAESFAIAKAGLKDYGVASVTTGWGSYANGTIGTAWSESARGITMTTQTEEIQDKDENGRLLCTMLDENGIRKECICDGEIGGESGCSEKKMESIETYAENQAVNSVFQEVLADVEKEAQAKYNAKLTKEQNICLAQNSGANPDATYVWAKMKGNRVPKDYAQQGLKDSSTPSNDLYNSFCRIKVTLQSEDHDIQTLLNGGTLTVETNIAGRNALGLERSERGKATIKGKNDSTAYFATGDSFNCGSWISSETLEALSDNVGVKARRDAGEGSQAEKNALGWAIAGSGLVGGIGSFIGMNAIQNNNSSLGGLLKKSDTHTDKQRDAARECVGLADVATNDIDQAVEAVGKATEKDTSTANTLIGTAKRNMTSLVSSAKKAGLKNYINTSIPSVTISGDNTNAATVKSLLASASSQIATLKASCEAIVNENDVDQDEARKKRLTANGIAAGVSALATAGIAAGITRSVQKAKYENAQNAAVKEFMETLGSKIHCYVGGELVGDFGDIITVNIEE